MKNYFKQTQRGFTLLELVVVIAVTGVLLVVAMPKLLGTSNDARQAAVNKVAESLTAALGQNYVVRSADNSKGVTMTSCSVAGTALQAQAFPSGYTSTDTTGITAVTASNTGSVTATICVLSTTTTPILTASFSVYGIL